MIILMQVVFDIQNSYTVPQDSVRITESTRLLNPILALICMSEKKWSIKVRIKKKWLSV